MKGVVIVSVIVFVLVLSLPFRAKMFGDLTFHLEAKKIASWVWGKNSFSEITLEKAPGPSLFYAIPYSIVGPDSTDKENWYLAVGWNFLWITLSLLLLRYSALILFDSRAAHWVIWSSILIPLHFYYSLGILAEPMAFSGCVFFLAGTVNVFSHKKSNLLNALLLSFGFIFMSLSRPNIGLVFLFIALTLPFVYKRNKLIKRTLTIFFSKLTIVSFTIIMLVFWSVSKFPGNQQKKLQGSYFLHVAQHGRYQFRNEIWDWRFWDDNIRSDSKDYMDWNRTKDNLEAQISQSGKSRYDVYLNWVLDDVLSHPCIFLRQSLMRFLYGNFLQISSYRAQDFNLGPFRGIVLFYLIHIGINVINLMIVLASFISFFLYVKDKPFIFLLVLPWVSLVIFHSFIYMEPRYLFPARPVFLLLASPVLAAWWSAITKHLMKLKTIYK